MVLENSLEEVQHSLAGSWKEIKGFIYKTHQKYFIVNSASDKSHGNNVIYLILT
jgi:hypothetical protein